jgi:adenine phosphoribosyltransferase
MNHPPTLSAAVLSRLRDVPDFPRPGILFKDITPLLGDAELFAQTTEAMASAFRGAGVTHVAAVESRGFLFGAPVARSLKAGLIPLRKPGKLPRECYRAEYALEYGADALEAHRDACGAAARVLVVDDVLATGGTARAAAELVSRTGAQLAGFAFVLELTFLAGRAALPAAPIESVART